MRPKEVEKLKAFREAYLKVYTGFGNQGRDKVWVGYEVTGILKQLVEFYDNLFREELTGKANEPTTEQ